MTITNYTDRELQQAQRIAELEAENTAICTLMNSYNTGGWTDSLTLIKERDALAAENEKLSYLWSVMKAKRDQLYAQIEASQKQEAVAWLSEDVINERYLSFDKPIDDDPVQPLFAAPVVAPDVKQYGDDRAREALEMAAKACEALDPYNIDKGRDTDFIDCADAIRALKELIK